MLTKSTYIHNLDDLKLFLRLAMQLEHATIPPYLTALYSLKPGTNSDAAHVIRTVAVEEMLHLTLVANILNSIGGRPDLTGPNFVAEYPAYLPDGDDHFKVNIAKFSRKSLNTFLKIERPATVPETGLVLGKTGAVMVDTTLPEGCTPILQMPHAPEMHFYSIGEFYKEIRRGLQDLTEQLGEEALFIGDSKLQITPEYYYSGGGQIIEVTNLATALSAIELISEQGEGYDNGIYGSHGELAHYYRFQEICKGRYYQTQDNKTSPPSEPSGDPLEVVWEAVYPIKTNAEYRDYEADPALLAAVKDFSEYYRMFLVLLTTALNGHRELLVEAVAKMFKIRDKINAIVRNPMPGQDGVNAGPIFVHHPFIKARPDA